MYDIPIPKFYGFLDILMKIIHSNRFQQQQIIHVGSILYIQDTGGIILFIKNNS